MNSIVKQRWLEALRSGQYKQGRNRLREGQTYCCLGVLCDLYNKDGWESHGKVGYSFRADNLNTVGLPPSKVSHWAFDAAADPVVPREDAQKYLTFDLKARQQEAYAYTDEEMDDSANKHLFKVALSQLNDYGASFEEIANVIEHLL